MVAYVVIYVLVNDVAPVAEVQLGEALPELQHSGGVEDFTVGVGESEHQWVLEHSPC